MWKIKTITIDVNSRAMKEQRTWTDEMWIYMKHEFIWCMNIYDTWLEKSIIADYLYKSAEHRQKFSVCYYYDKDENEKRLEIYWVVSAEC